MGKYIKLKSVQKPTSVVVYESIGNSRKDTFIVRFQAIANMKEYGVMSQSASQTPLFVFVLLCLGGHLVYTAQK